MYLNCKNVGLMNTRALCYTKCNNQHDGKLLRSVSQCLALKTCAFGSISEKNVFFAFLPSCEPIIRRSAYEAAIYFKLLCQYFCLKASLIPCVDSVEAFYHCFLFEFDLAAFSP